MRSYVQLVYATARATVRRVLRTGLLFPLFIVQALQLLLVPPIHGLPSTDDWMYADMAATLVLEHRYDHHPCVQPIAIMHVAWGALFQWLLGSGYVPLKISTLVLSLVCVWAIARSAEECGLNRWQALFCGITTLVNPAYVHLSNTYMSDIPYMAYSALSALFYVRALQDRRPADLAWGSVWGVMAFFVRQFGLLPAVALALVAGLAWLRERRTISIPHFVAFSGPWIVAAIGLVTWQANRTDVFDWTPKFSDGPLAYRAIALAAYYIVVATLAGLCLLPALATAIPRAGKVMASWRRLDWGLFVLWSALASIVFLFVIRAPMPQPGNTLHPMGVGPRIMQDDPAAIREAVAGVYPLLVVITGIGIACIGFFGLALAAYWRRCRVEQVGSITRQHHRREPSDRHLDKCRFLLIWTVLVVVSSYTPYVAVPFDRYLLPIIGPLSILTMLAMGTPLRRSGMLCGGVCAASMYAFGIAALQDYTAWNRARWEALDYLVRERQAPLRQIDGGYEFNGIYHSAAWIETFRPREFRDAEAFGWWVFDDAYKVTFNPIPGYSTLREFPYVSWLTLKRRVIYAQIRNGSDLHDLAQTPNSNDELSLDMPSR